MCMELINDSRRSLYCDNMLCKNASNSTPCTECKLYLLNGKDLESISIGLFCMIINAVDNKLENSEYRRGLCLENIYITCNGIVYCSTTQCTSESGLKEYYGLLQFVYKSLNLWMEVHESLQDTVIFKEIESTSLFANCTSQWNMLRPMFHNLTVFTFLDPLGTDPDDDFIEPRSITVYIDF